MARESTGEFLDKPKRDKFDELLDRVNVADAVSEAEELDRNKNIVWLDDLLKSHGGRVVHLSNPDGSYNKIGLDLFEASRLKGKSLEGLHCDSDIKTVIDDEQWLYFAIFDLLNMSDDTSDSGISKVNELKQQIISVWMKYRSLPFESGWVSFLNEILPGGEVFLPDIELAEMMDQESGRQVAEATLDITSKLIIEYQQGPVFNGIEVCQIANQYVETALDLICVPIKDGTITTAEINNRIAEIQTLFALSPSTHWRCLAICAKMIDCDLVGAARRHGN